MEDPVFLLTKHCIIALNYQENKWRLVTNTVDGNIVYNALQYCLKYVYKNQILLKLCYFQEQRFQTVRRLHSELVTLYIKINLKTVILLLHCKY